MHEWQTSPLDECLDTLLDYRGKSPPRSEKGIPVLSAKVVKTTGLLRPIEQKIAPDYYPKWMVRGLPQVNDVVMTTEAPMGEVIQLDQETVQYALGQRIVCLRGKPKKLDNTFLRYLLTSPTQQAILASYATGTTVLGISQKALRSVPITYPGFHQQQQIGEMLRALDDKIDLNRRMNETLEATARAIFKDWFVDFGPVRAKAEGRPPPGLASDIAVLFPDALDKEGMPVGWSKSPLVKLTSKIGSGATPKGGKSVYVEKGTNLIRSQNVYDHNFVWDGLAKLRDDSASRLAGVTVEREDILINITGDSILRTCVVDPAVLPARVNQHVAIVRAREGIPSRFLHLFLVQQSSKMSLLGYDAGGSRAAVTKGHLEVFPVLLPTTGVLEAFEQLVAPFFQRVDSNRAESRTLAALRDLLLPKLMAGEIRIRDAEMVIEDAA